MKKSIAFILLILCALPLSAQTGKQIMQSVMDAQNSSSSAMEMNMTLVDASGSTSLRTIQTLTSKTNGLVKTVTLFLTPASVKNTRFLTIENEGRDDDQWIFLPALGKVKRISAAERNGSFMGSDFTYSDMASLNVSVDGSSHQLLREEAFGGATCYVVESVPYSVGDYGKTVTYVSKSNYVVMRVDFYSKDKTAVVKTLTAENAQQVQGHWIAKKMTMTTKATGHKTIVEINQIKYDMAVNQAYFTEYFLETGRTQ